MKATLARGAKGDLIERLQQALSKIAVPTEGGQQEPAIATVDGDFGRSTQLAIQRVQAKFGKPITGVVDAELWELISKEADWPGKFERCLGLVAAFEGHGYTKAAGNWDKAGITWGIIGFILITCGKVKKKTVLKYGPLRDLLKEAFVKHEATMIAAIVAKHGRLDGVVNNAGGSPFVLAAEASDNFARKIIELNLVAPLVVARAAHAVMAGQDGGGAIVNVSSVSGHRPSPGTSAYGASKAGLDNLTESLAVEWAPTVRLNSVVCGPIETELSHLHYGDADGVAAVGATIPMGRLASPADVGNAVAFLLSPLAAYITGSTLTLHGGGEKPAFLDAANADNSV